MVEPKAQTKNSGVSCVIFAFPHNFYSPLFNLWKIRSQERDYVNEK